MEGRGRIDNLKPRQHNILFGSTCYCVETPNVKLSCCFACWLAYIVMRLVESFYNSNSKWKGGNYFFIKFYSNFYQKAKAKNLKPKV